MPPNCTAPTEMEKSTSLPRSAGLTGEGKVVTLPTRGARA